MRELLMDCGILPKVDEQICSLERWLLGHLAAIPDHNHARIIKRFAPGSPGPSSCSTPSR